MNNLLDMMRVPINRSFEEDFTFPNSVQLHSAAQWDISPKILQVFKSFCHNLLLKLFQYLPKLCHLYESSNFWKVKFIQNIDNGLETVNINGENNPCLILLGVNWVHSVVKYGRALWDELKKICWRRKKFLNGKQCFPQIHWLSARKKSHATNYWRKHCCWPFASWACW